MKDEDYRRKAFERRQRKLNALNPDNSPLLCDSNVLNDECDYFVELWQDGELIGHKCAINADMRFCNRHCQFCTNVSGSDIYVERRGRKRKE